MDALIKQAQSGVAGSKLVADAIAAPGLFAFGELLPFVKEPLDLALLEVRVEREGLCSDLSFFFPPLR